LQREPGLPPGGGGHGKIAMTPAAPPERAYATIDLMRFLAALAVVWNHVWNLVALPTADMGPLWKLVFQSAGFGQDAVRIFFVISGYWITSTILRRMDSGDWSWPTYMIDRLSRLMIVLVPCLAIGLCLDSLGRHVFEWRTYSSLDFIERSDFDVGANLDAATLAGNLLFLQNIWFEPFGSNFPLWSLANEFWYYVWFPAIVLAVRGRFSFFSILTIATLVLFARSNVFEGFFIWLLGAAVCIGTRRLAAPACSIPRVWRNIIVWSAFVAFAASLGAVHLWPQTWLVDGLVSGVGFSMFLAAVILFDVGAPRITAPLSRFGAEASFSLYLLHFPLVLFMLSLITLDGPQPASGPGLLLALGLVLMALIASYAFSLATERRTDALRRRMRELTVSAPPKLG
jgi:peptidoglycan/LPS O-acetylase OafA/YrhL